MKTAKYTLPGMTAIEQVRVASRSSVVVRTVLVGTLAIGVTIGSVMAGAVVVAPLVARATQPDATAQLAQSLANVSATSSSVFHSAIARVQTTLQTTVEQLPAPVSQYALPGIAAITMVGLLSSVLLRRRSPHRSLIPAQTSFAPSARTMERLTPHANQKISGRHQKTPRAVNALAASGASSTDIAWRTGLPIDAVQLLLALANTPRQFQPPTA